MFMNLLFRKADFPPECMVKDDGEPLSFFSLLSFLFFGCRA